MMYQSLVQGENVMEYIYEKNRVTDIDYWNYLKSNLHPGDIIKIQTLNDFVEGILDLNEKLTFCKNNNIILYEEKYDIQLNAERELNNLWTILDLKNEEHQKRQLDGIRKAVELKRQGKGAYGRPSAKLPKDFKDIVSWMKDEHRPLEPHRKEIGMKKSTFYKYVKIVLCEKENL